MVHLRSAHPSCPSVSILVFVELALDARLSLSSGSDPQGFNPCFRGTCSWWYAVFFDGTRAAWFQSLFSWNLLLMSKLLNAASLEDGFQSLFSWNLLLMLLMVPLPDRSRTCPQVSILVFVELALDDYDWHCVWVAHKVSILVFVELALDVSCRVIHERAHRFQSLFSWNLLLMPRIIPCRYSEYCFNPCFRGTCSWCLCLYDWRISWTSVSILVFVELALDVSMISPAEFSDLSFNPCFRGTCSWWFTNASVSTDANGFNPCFRGTCSWCCVYMIGEYLEPVFQSLFSWNLLLMGSEQEHEPAQGRVSILVFVELALDDLFQ